MSDGDSDHEIYSQFEEESHNIINNRFENPDDYLQVDKNMIIGNLNEIK